MPLNGSFYSRFAEAPIVKVLSDPTLLCKTACDTWKLFDYDVVMTAFDLTTKAEACGCSIDWQDNGVPIVSHLLCDDANVSVLQDLTNITTKGRLPTMLEATHRLKIVVGQTVATAVVLTHPLTLAVQLRGPVLLTELQDEKKQAKEVLNLAKQITVAACKAYCELRPDILLIADEFQQCLPPTYLTMVSSLLTPLFNIARFYQVHTVLIEKEPLSIEHIFSLRPEGAVVTGSCDWDHVKSLAHSYNCIPCVAIPCDMLTRPTGTLTPTLSNFLLNIELDRFLLTTDWEIPYNTPLENMKELIKVIREYQQQS